MIHQDHSSNEDMQEDSDLENSDIEEGFGDYESGNKTAGRDNNIENFLSDQFKKSVAIDSKTQASSSIVTEPSIQEGSAIDTSKTAKVPRYKRRLFVGEADFSYTRALLEKHPEIAGSRIVATEYKQMDDLTYENFTNNISMLEKKGVIVKFGIDATKLHENDNFKDKRFKRIQFNRPHTGHDFSDPQKHLQCMIADFFKSARELQREGDYVQIALPEGSDARKEPWMSTNREFRHGLYYNLYDAARMAGYRLLKKRRFGTSRYRSYTTIDIGRNESSENPDELREYIFVKTNCTPEEILKSHPPLNVTEIYDKSVKGKVKFNILQKIHTDDDSSDYLDSETSSEVDDTSVDSSSPATLTFDFQRIKSAKSHPGHSLRTDFDGDKDSKKRNSLDKR